MPVFLRNYRYHVKKNLYHEAMQEAAGQFIGEHDFRSFMTDAAAFEASTVKTIFDAHVRQKGRELLFVVTGSGFLYNMVRIMAGTLTDVGLGRIRPREIREILLAGDRSRAGHTAPPQGLYMARVYFDGASLREGMNDYED